MGNLARQAIQDLQATLDSQDQMGHLEFQGRLEQMVNLVLLDL